MTFIEAMRHPLMQTAIPRAREDLLRVGMMAERKMISEALRQKPLVKSEAAMREARAIRTEVMKFIKRNPGCSFAEIIAGVPQGQNALKQRLNKMKRAGVVTASGKFGHLKYYVVAQ